MIVWNIYYEQFLLFHLFLIRWTSSNSSFKSLPGFERMITDFQSLPKHELFLLWNILLNKYTDEGIQQFRLPIDDFHFRYIWKESKFKYCWRRIHLYAFAGVSNQSNTIILLMTSLFQLYRCSGVVVTTFFVDLWSTRTWRCNPESATWPSRDCWVQEQQKHKIREKALELLVK